MGRDREKVLCFLVDIITRFHLQDIGEYKSYLHIIYPLKYKWTRAWCAEIEKHIISAKLIQAERFNGCFLQMPPALRQEMKPDGAALGGCLPGSSRSHVLGSVSTFHPKWLLLGQGFGQTYPGSAPVSCQRWIHRLNKCIGSYIPHI